MNKLVRRVATIPLGLCVIISFASNAQSINIAIASTLDETGFGSTFIDAFATTNSCQINLIGASSLRAINLLTQNDVDAAITHAPTLQQELLATDNNFKVVTFMQSKFVLVGPADDPANVKNLELADAFSTIANKQHTFFSRADGSGTHEAETKIWQSVLGDVPQQSDWYLHVGTQMALALQITDQLNGYTLSEYATFMFLKSRGLTLKIISDNQETYPNIYSLLLSKNPSSCVDDFAKWIISDPAQQVIHNFSINNTFPFVTAL